jgi:hypothetical protein
MGHPSQDESVGRSIASIENASYQHVHNVVCRSTEDGNGWIVQRPTVDMKVVDLRLAFVPVVGSRYNLVTMRYFPFS